VAGALTTIVVVTVVGASTWYGQLYVLEDFRVSALYTTLVLATFLGALAGGAVGGVAGPCQRRA